MNRVAIVVLNWNGADIIGKCLYSLKKLQYNNFQIVVIDNNSQDTSREVLQKMEKEFGDLLHVIYHHTNSGFDGGVNIGIHYALSHKFDSIALFNSDAEPDKKWLGHLVNILKTKKEVGIATGLLLHEDGKTIDSTGDWYSKWGLSFPRSRDQKSNIIPESGYVFSASGGASLYRAELFKDIGIFDEDFFAYYEDVDISFRAQLAGWKVYYTNKAIAYHEQGGTSKKIPGFTIKQTFRNLPLLFIKNVPAPFLIPIGVRLFLAYWLMLFNTIRHGSFHHAFRGWLESVYLTPAALRHRFSIQKQKRVSNKYIWSIIWKDLPPEQSGLRKFRALFGVKS